MIVHLVATSIFWLNYFPSYKPSVGISNTKFSGKLVIGTVVEYKNCFRLQSGEYFQVHQEDEPQNTINIDQTVVSIVLGTQYNLQGECF